MAETVFQERISQPMVEHIVDVSVPPIFDEVVGSVDVPMPQFAEEVLEVVQIFEVSVPQEQIADASISGRDRRGRVVVPTRIACSGSTSKWWSCLFHKIREKIVEEGLVGSTGASATDRRAICGRASPTKYGGCGAASGLHRERSFWRQACFLGYSAEWTTRELG